MQCVVDEGFAQKDSPFVKGWKMPWQSTKLMTVGHLCATKSFVLYMYVVRSCRNNMLGTCTCNHLIFRFLSSFSLKKKTLKDLASKQTDINVKTEAEEIADKFVTVFTLFRNCHKIHNSCALTGWWAQNPSIITVQFHFYIHMYHCRYQGFMAFY